MEIKKYPKANLERKWHMRFVFSLVVVVIVFFIVLWFPYGDWTTEIDDNDGPLEEFELNQIKREEQRISLALKQQPKEAAQEIKVVDKLEEINTMELPEEKREQEDENLMLSDSEKEKQKEDPNLFAEADNALDNNPLNFRVVEDLPQFPDGPLALMKWLTDNLKYPASAQRKKIQGKVVVQFIVTADGSITDLKLAKRLEATCDQEAMRVMRMMPKWKPGLQDGKPCRTMVSIPIVFKL